MHQNGASHNMAWIMLDNSAAIIADGMAWHCIAWYLLGVARGVVLYSHNLSVNRYRIDKQKKTMLTYSMVLIV